MGGICNTFSSEEAFTVITSSYSVIGDLNSQSFVVKSEPQNTSNFDWIPLTTYSDNHNGFKYRLNNNMVARTDTNLLNNPPIALVDPIITVYSGNDTKIVIPVLDIDEDLILCKLFMLCRKLSVVHMKFLMYF
jgi:hypothetical protein